MTLWIAIALACAATFFTKWAGYAVPARWLNNPRMARVAGASTVALLSALTVMNTFAAGATLVLDARLAALAVAALALWARLLFLLVVVLGRWLQGWCGCFDLDFQRAGPALSSPCGVRSITVDCGQC